MKRTAACLLAAALLGAGGTVGTLVVPQAAAAATARVADAPLNVDPTAYPYADSAANKQDPWGFAIRQCTSYAAWWLNANGLNLTSYTRGPAGAAHFGNASGWAAAAQQAGWAVSLTPQVGAIAQWNAGETSSWTGATQTDSFTAGSLGHVAVVTAVDASTGLATLDSYNVNDDEAFSSFQGVAPRYLLIGFAPPTATAGTTAPAPVRTVVAPVTRSVTGVVLVYDARGRRTKVKTAPVVVASGTRRVKPRLLAGGGFHVTVVSPGPWRVSGAVPGYRCSAVTVGIAPARPVKVSLVCRR